VYNGQNPHKLTWNNCIYLNKTWFPEEKATDKHDSDDTDEPLIFLAFGSYNGVRKPRLESGGISFCCEGIKNRRHLSWNE